MSQLNLISVGMVFRMGIMAWLNIKARYTYEMGTSMLIVLPVHIYLLLETTVILSEPQYMYIPFGYEWDSESFETRNFVLLVLMRLLYFQGCN